MKPLTISCNKVSYSIGDHEILRDVSFSAFKGEVVVLVGPNGVGKSTLLKIIANNHMGTDRHSDGMNGKIETGSDNKIAYFPQEIPEEYWGMKVKDYIPAISRSKIEDLNLDSNILEKNISELSGGEKSKVNIMKIVDTGADLFLLDEPTNNLDNDAIKYLESFIDNSKSTFIIVSHDRQLLENFADKIVEIDSNTKTSNIYPGPFSEYMRLRKEKIENEWKRYNDYLSNKDVLKKALQEKKEWSQQGEKGPKKTDNEKMSAGNMKDWSGKVLGRSVKNAERKLNELQEVEKPKELASIDYPIQIKERSGDLVFELKNVSIRRGNKIIGPINLKIQSKDKIVILGKNGAGKTSVIKTLLGEIASESGDVRTGSKVLIGYLPQESEITEKTILQNIKDLSPDEETEFRKILNNFSITKDKINRNIGELSPGERSRLVLASIIARRPNCIILDEPTNHLDIYALDFLEEAIKTYEGTIIIVTHDRYFLNHIGDYRVFNI